MIRAWLKQRIARKKLAQHQAANLAELARVRHEQRRQAAIKGWNRRRVGA